MIHLKEYNTWINEKINFSKFPNPLPDDTKGFLKAGLPQHDKSPFDDDIVETEDVSIPVKDLIPTQSEVYLGKALELSIRGIEGGDLGAVISKDGYIMDGHHRWACTMLNNPEKEVGGVMVDLPFNELLVVLRAVGDSMKNPRGTKPSGGDVNIFHATMEDVKDCIFKGKHMDPSLYDRDKAIAWYESKGEDNIQDRLLKMQEKNPGDLALPREEMPKVRATQVPLVKKLLNNGSIDII